jgi:hypothetical protein
LLRREEPLLLLSNIEEPLRCFPMRSSHNTILQIFCSIRKLRCLGLTIHSYYPMLQKGPKSSRFCAIWAKIAKRKWERQVVDFEGIDWKKEGWGGRRKANLTS